MQVKALPVRQVTQDICAGIHCLLSGAEVSLGHSWGPEETWLLVQIVISHPSNQNDLWKCSCREYCQAKILASGKSVTKISESLWCLPNLRWDSRRKVCMLFQKGKHSRSVFCFLCSSCKCKHSTTDLSRFLSAQCFTHPGVPNICSRVFHCK